MYVSPFHNKVPEASFERLQCVSGEIMPTVHATDHYIARQFVLK